jgi:ligand-binding sensor domain-containing protein
VVYIKKNKRNNKLLLSLLILIKNTAFMLLKKIIFLINALLCVFNAQAQENNIPIGEWRVHLPYHNITTVEVIGNTTYAGAAVNSFYIDHSDNSSHILSTINGLSDIEITKIRYHKELNLTIIAYLNGNIDIIKDNTVINISDIKRKNIIGSKRINHIYFYHNLAYLSCDFGLVVLNLTRLEIKETYSNLASGSLSNRIYATTFSSDGDSIFIATERGLMTGKNSPGINLMDYSNWFTYSPSEGLPTASIRSVATFNNQIYTGVNNSFIKILNGNTWVDTPMYCDDVRNMNVSQGKMLVCTGERVLLISDKTSFFTFYSPTHYPTPTDALLDENGFIWIGDGKNGLMANNGTNGAFVNYTPNGPGSNRAFNLYYFNNKIVVTKGGYDNVYTPYGNPPEYYIFDNYEWKTFNTLTSGIPSYNDIITPAYNSFENKLYLSSYGYGILVDNQNNSFEFIDDTLAPFKRALPQAGPYVRISDIEIDKEGSLWVTSTDVPGNNDQTLHWKKLNGTWQSKSFGFTAGRHPLEIIIDDNNYKWLRIRIDRDGGLIVFDEKKNVYKYITDQAGAGGLPKKGVRAIAKDLKGEIWVGTEEGIAIFNNPQTIFSSSPLDASIPIFDGFPLLYQEHITCIKVDGGNRKWIGTRNGLWLFNDDGSEIISNFTIENSPLLSNSIQDVEINALTGEVFIATDKGIISYRGTATKGNKEHSTVKVFPNPVKPDYNGLVGISGLTRDAIIKITDIYGNLIYETKAEGGTAVWNAKNYNGQKARTGVYLIYSSSDDGIDTFVAKVAVVE